MRRVFLCLVTLFVCAACEPETTIRVHGMVTAADDGSPIAGASVEVGVTWTVGDQRRARVQANNQGDYSLSFIEMGYPCPEGLYNISASAQGFQSVGWRGLQVGPDEPRVRCTDELQTIDFQLERETTASTIWMRR